MNDSGDFAIRVSDLTKEFKIYAKPADMFWELATSRPRHKLFRALSGVSFDVKRGQVVGIMGRNGAGKSTLLKIITGTLDKTSGDVQVNGRISSILELGIGFNGEFSGRDNVYIGGLMVGLSHKEILDKMDWIINFSELEDFIDQPFKIYSTGMQARLIFSTAVCIDPDILIVDEVLSVGDARFQRKSFGKIEEFRKQGRTILLVTHSTNTISEFCDYAILLDSGHIFDQGEPYRISQVYYKMLFASEREQKRIAEDTARESDATNVGVTNTVKGIVPSTSPEIPLDTQTFTQEKGFCWRAELTGFETEGDSNEYPQRSEYILFENDLPLKPAHWTHDYIRWYGRGAHSHWGKALYFSTSDNSNPCTNGRTYSLKMKNSLIKESDAGIATDGNTTDVKAHKERLAIRNLALNKIGLAEAFDQHNSHQMQLGNKKAEILDFGILDQVGKKVVQLISGKQYDFYFIVLYYEDISQANAGFLIRNLKGMEMFGTTMRALNLPIPSRKRGDLVEARLHVTMWLTNGYYFLTVNTADPLSDSDAQYDSRYDGYQFEVLPTPGIFTSSIVNLDPVLKVKYL